MTSSLPPASTSSERFRLSGLWSRFVDVRPGEGVVVVGACAVLGGIVAAHVLLETARDAFFLTKLGPKALPLVYMTMAALGFVAARADHFIARTFGRQNALVLGLMGAATGTMLFYSEGMGQVRAFALYLWAGVITTLLTVQFWLAAGQRITPAQGRRLYGLLTAGGVFGGVVGAGLGALLAERFSIQSLLLAAAGLHLLTAGLATIAPPATMAPIVAPRVGITERLDEVRKSSYLVRVGLLILVSVATLLLVDYLFKSEMTARLPPARLGVSLARYYAAMNAVALVVQLFIAMRVLQRMGTVLALTILPLAILSAGAMGLVFSAPLLFVLMAKSADGVLRFSLHRVSTELLFLPLGVEERARTKTLFDSVLTRVTQGLVALAVFLGTRFADASDLTFSIVTAGLALSWIGLAWSLRKPYLERFRAMLGGSARRSGFAFDELNLDSLSVLVEALSSPDESRVLAAMQLFKEGNRTKLVPALLLYHPSPRVLVRALEILPAKGREDWVQLAERLLGHADEQVRLTAIRALGSSGHLARVDPATYGDHPGLTAAAAFFQADATEQPSSHPGLEELLSETSATVGQVTLLEAIARSNSPGWADAVQRLEALGRPELDRVLPAAMAKTRDRRFIDPLILRLSRREGRSDVRRALVAFGDVALEALEKTLYDGQTPPALRLHIPRAISRFDNQRAGEILLASMEQHLAGALRYKSLRGLGRLVAMGAATPDPARVLPLIERNLTEHLRLAAAHAALTLRQGAPPLTGVLLFGLLEDKMRQALERTLRLIQILHPREDFRRVYHGLLSEDGRSRVAATEILEVTSLGYGEQIQGLLRQLGDRKRAPSAEPPRTELTSLSDLLGDPDPLISALSAAYAKDLDIAELETAIESAFGQNAWLTEGWEDAAP